MPKDRTASLQDAFEGFEAATPLGFGQDESGASVPWEILLPDGASADALIAAWALLLSRYSGEESVSLGIREAGSAAARPLRVNVDERLEIKEYLAGVGRLRAAPVISEQALRKAINQDAGAPLYLSEVFITPEGAAGIRGQGATSSPTLSMVKAQLIRMIEGLKGDGRVCALPLLSPGEEARMVSAWNPPPTPYPASTVHALFERQVEASPEATALIEASTRVSYQRLNEESNRLAHLLRENGVRPGQRIALLLPRGAALITSMLAVLKAGGSYVPLDAGFPNDRLRQMIDAAAPALIISTSDLTTGLKVPPGPTLLHLNERGDQLATMPAENPQVECSTEWQAYTMFTSGSTGQPKGVCVTHRGIVRLLFGVEYAEFNHQTVLLHIAAASFDASTFEIWGALLHGGTCVLSLERVPSIELVGRLIAEHRVNTLFLTTALFNLFIDTAPQALAPVRQLLTGGEEASTRHFNKALEELPATRLIHCYGPTENTVFSTTYAVDRAAFAPDRPLPIGRAIAHSTCYVLDRELRPVPVGVCGELYVGGAGVALGYAGQRDLTGERFIEDPFAEDPDARMYKTGDLVYWNREGFLVFSGRVDQQVKVRGFRIELGEIETVLERFEGVDTAAVQVYEDSVRGKWLAGYVKVSDPERFRVADLEDFLRETLPEYMVPTVLIPVGDWTYTSSGKLDRKALPRPVFDAASSHAFVPPATATQRMLAKLWEELLSADAIGIDDDFFEVGGNSLLAVQLFHEINLTCGRDLPLAMLTQCSTVRGLAALIDDGREAGGERDGYRSLQVIQEGDSARVPLFLVHGGMGNVLMFKAFSQRLGARQPVYAFQWSGWDGFPGDTTIEGMAQTYCEELIRFHPGGPIHLGGFCVGGLIVLQMAERLRAAGIEVIDPLFVFDTPNLSATSYHTDEPWDGPQSLIHFKEMIDALNTLRDTSPVSHHGPVGVDFALPSGKGALVRKMPGAMRVLRKAKQVKEWRRQSPERKRIRAARAAGEPLPIDLRALHSQLVLIRAAKTYGYPRYPGRALYFRSDCVLGRFFALSGWWNDPCLGFGELCARGIEAYAVGGDHPEFMDQRGLVDLVRPRLEEHER